mgnify:CR=1 FL=1
MAKSTPLETILSWISMGIRYKGIWFIWRDICTRDFEIDCIFDQINDVITPIRTLSVALMFFSHTCINKKKITSHQNNWYLWLVWKKNNFFSIWSKFIKITLLHVSSQLYIVVTQTLFCACYKVWTVSKWSKVAW